MSYGTLKYNRPIKRDKDGYYVLQNGMKEHLRNWNPSYILFEDGRGYYFVLDSGRHVRFNNINKGSNNRK